MVAAITAAFYFLLQTNLTGLPEAGSGKGLQMLMM